MIIFCLNLIIGLLISSGNGYAQPEKPHSRSPYLRTPLRESHTVCDRTPLCFRRQAVALLQKDIEKNNYETEVVYVVSEKGGWKKAPRQAFWKNQLEPWYQVYQKGNREEIEAKLKATLECKIIPADDPREGLRGQRTVIAATQITADKILGFYAGVYCAADKKGTLSCDQTLELNFERYHLQATRQPKALLEDYQGYEAEIPLGDEKILITAYNRGNSLSLINCCRGSKNEEKNIEDLENVRFVVLRLGSLFPVFTVVTNRLIQKGEELLVDYGKKYWGFQNTLLKKCGCKGHFDLEKRLLVNTFESSNDPLWFTLEETIKKYTLPFRKKKTNKPSTEVYYNKKGKTFYFTRQEARKHKTSEKLWTGSDLKDQFLVNLKGQFIFCARKPIWSSNRGKNIEVWQKPFDSLLTLQERQKTQSYSLTEAREKKKTGQLKTYGTWRKNRFLVDQRGQKVLHQNSKHRTKASQNYMTQAKYRESLFVDPDKKEAGRRVAHTSSTHFIPLGTRYRDDARLVNPHTGQSMSNEEAQTLGVKLKSWGAFRRQFPCVNQKGEIILSFDAAKEHIANKTLDLQKWKEEWGRKNPKGEILTLAAYNTRCRLVDPKTGIACTPKTPGSITKSAWNKRQARKKRSTKG